MISDDDKMFWKWVYGMTPENIFLRSEEMPSDFLKRVVGKK